MAKPTTQTDELSNLVRCQKFEDLGYKLYSKEAWLAPSIESSKSSNFAYMMYARPNGGITLHPDTFTNWSFQDLIHTNSDNSPSILDVLILRSLFNSYSYFQSFSHIFKNLSFSDMQKVCGPSKAKGLGTDHEQSLLAHAASKKPFMQLLGDSLKKLTPDQLNQPIDMLGGGQKTLIECATKYHYLNLLDHNIIKQFFTLDIVRDSMFKEIPKEEFLAGYREAMNEWESKKASCLPKDEKSERSAFIKGYLDGVMEVITDLTTIDPNYSNYYELIGDSLISHDT